MNKFWNSKIITLKPFEIMDLSEIFLKYQVTLEKWGIKDDHLK